MFEHVLRDRGLRDVEAQLQQLAMNARGSPQRILLTHTLNKVAKLAIDFRPAAEVAGLPAPPRPKAHAMPTHDRLRPDDRDGTADIREKTIEPDQDGGVASPPLQAAHAT